MTMMTGTDLKGRRKSMGLTQKALGDTLGLSERTVARYEAKGCRTVPRWLGLVLSDRIEALSAGLYEVIAERDDLLERLNTLQNNLNKLVFDHWADEE